jgi:hypothetical protein
MKAYAAFAHGRSSARAEHRRGLPGGADPHLGALSPAAAPVGSIAPAPITPVATANAGVAVYHPARHSPEQGIERAPNAISPLRLSIA